MASSEKQALPPCEEAYDYVRFTTADINGIPRGVTVPARHVDKFLNDGVQVYAG